MGNYVGNDPAPGGLVLVGDTNPVGEIAFFHAAPNSSWAVLNGQLLLKASYPDLWAYAQGFLTADQAANPGLYRDVDANSFAVPKLDGLFIRAAGQVDANHVAAALGAKQVDQNLAHTHTASDGGGFQTTTAGPSYGSSVAGSSSAATTSSNGGTEGRPVNVALVACVKALRTVLMPAVSFPDWGITVLPAQAAAGTFVDFTIPAGVKQLTVSLAGVSTNGVSGLQVRLGAGGVLESTGYLGGGNRGGGAGDLTGLNIATGFETVVGLSAASLLHGSATLALMNPLTNLWSCAMVLGQSDATRAGVTGGTKALAAALDRVRVTTANGTDTFDAGSIGVQYQK